MKILHIYDGPDRVFLGEGSLPSIVYNIAKYTAAEGQDVTILERKWEGLDYKEQIEGVKFERIELHICSSISRKETLEEIIKNPIKLLRFISDRTEFAFKAYKYIIKSNPDVIHVHLPFVADILVSLSRKSRKKMIYGEQIGDEDARLKLGSTKDISLLFKIFSPDLYLMKRVKKVVMLNERRKSRIVSASKVKPETATVILTGVDTSEFTPVVNIGDIKERYGLSDKTTVLFASDIIPRKGVEYLIRAANIIVNQWSYRDMMFFLIGKKSEREYFRTIRKLIDEYKLEKNIKIIGYIPQEDLKKLYIVSDIYVLPSLEDGGPTSLLEPLACGKPLVGTDVGGIAPQIKDGWNGFLVEPANEKQLAEKIKYLLDHPEKWEEMGKNSRRLAEEEFDWKKIAEKYLEVYEEVMRSEGGQK